jgi:hypothetical protein
MPNIDKISGVRGGGDAGALDVARLFTAAQEKTLAAMIEKERGPAAMALGARVLRGGSTPPRNPIRARYMVVPPDIIPGPIALYIAPAPDVVAIDVHQALINRIVADRKVNKTEAELLKKLFDYDVAYFKKEKGKDVSAQVRKFLKKVLAGATLDKGAQKVFANWKLSPFGTAK